MESRKALVTKLLYILMIWTSFFRAEDQVPW